MDLQSKITRARADLVFEAPFFGAIALRLKMAETTDQDTFAVDGYTIFYNPEYADGLTVPETAGVIAHEVLHVAMLHHTRRGNRNRKLWNVACDLAINPIVLKTPKLKLPEGCLLDPKYEGMTAEAIYEDLVKEGTGDYNDTGGYLTDTGGLQLPFDEILDPPEDMKETAEQDAKSLANTGLAAAKQAGKMPGGIEGIIDSAHEEQVDWQDRLRDLLTNKARGDLTWNRPNRRFVDTQYLPYYKEEPAGNLVLAIDSSGSVDEKELEIYGSELNSIMRDNNIENLTVLWVDTKVQNVQEFTKDDDIVLKCRGRGGTRFEPAFEWVEENGVNPHAFIYFTDGYANFPIEEAPYPTIWCITSKIQAPWGDTIELKF